jgi:hypothetical protein
MYDGVRRSGDVSTVFEDREEVRAIAEVRNLDSRMVGLGGQRHRTASIAVCGSCDRPLVWPNGTGVGGLDVNEGLVADPDHLSGQIGTWVAVERFEQRWQVELRLGH